MSIKDTTKAVGLSFLFLTTSLTSAGAECLNLDIATSTANKLNVQAGSKKFEIYHHLGVRHTCYSIITVEEGKQIAQNRALKQGVPPSTNVPSKDNTGR